MTATSHRSSRAVAGWLALAVLSTLLFGTLALWLTDRANREQLETFNRILHVVEATRSAQVHFKTQVQEWKNVLLRGQDAADYERYLGQFHAEGARTVEKLERAAALKQALGLDSADVAAALSEHAALQGQYAEAVRGYQRGAVASVFAVDAVIRGRDRRLNDMIDAMAEAMRVEAERRTEAFAEADAQRYRRLRAIFIALSIATLTLVGWLVVLALRRA
jgi:methyl-accepting chemotaxis protein-1 (serine sensor receptor)